MKNARLSLARLLLAGALLVLVFAPSLRSTAELQVEPLSAPPLTLPTPTAASPEAKAAARALRSDDLQAVDHHLGALARRRPVEAARLRVISALAAYEAGEKEEAAARLAAAADPGGPFEDWRLLLLGELAAERGDLAAAQAWFDQLLATCLGSPLAPGAWLEAARVAERRGEPRQALDRIAAARSAGVTGEVAAELETLAWEVAAELADPAAGREAVRRLFVDSPAAGPEPAAEELRREAADFLDQGRIEPALDALRRLRRADPSDVTGARPLWEMGWAEYRRGNWTGALGAWTELAEIYPETGDAQRGRYWKGRALERIGRPERARDLYAQLVEESDTSDFYGRQALARLDGQAPPLPASPLAAPRPWDLDRRLRRARQLSDLGLDALALRELELAGRAGDPPSKRDRTALEAVILGRQGHRTASILQLREAYPALGGPRQADVPAEILYAYYPLDYGQPLADHARAQGLAPSLVAGVIRQESAFDPSATSRAGARGLMQLMPATARETAERLRLPAGALRLDDPEINLRLGSAYLRQVLDMFDGDLELALAGYNGGPNRIRRLWTEAGPGAGLDEFVEQLALEESRGYVKRVLVLSDSYRQLYPDLAGATDGV